MLLTKVLGQIIFFGSFLFVYSSKIKIENNDESTVKQTGQTRQETQTATNANKKQEIDNTTKTYDEKSNYIENDLIVCADQGSKFLNCQKLIKLYLNKKGTLNCYDSELELKYSLFQQGCQINDENEIETFYNSLVVDGYLPELNSCPDSSIIRATALTENEPYCKKIRR